MSTYGKYFAYGLKFPAFAGTTVGGYLDNSKKANIIRGKKEADYVKRF
jgi:hypothetical protein